MVLNGHLPTGTLEMIFLAVFVSNDVAIEVDREGSVVDTHTLKVNGMNLFLLHLTHNITQ